MEREEVLRLIDERIEEHQERRQLWLVPWVKRVRRLVKGILSLIEEIPGISSG